MWGYIIGLLQESENQFCTFKQQYVDSYELMIMLFNIYG